MTTTVVSIIDSICTRHQILSEIVLHETSRKSCSKRTANIRLDWKTGSGLEEPLSQHITIMSQYLHFSLKFHKHGGTVIMQLFCLVYEGGHLTHDWLCLVPCYWGAPCGSLPEDIHQTRLVARFFSSNLHYWRKFWSDYKYKSNRTVSLKSHTRESSCCDARICALRCQARSRLLFSLAITAYDLHSVIWSASCLEREFGLSTPSPVSSMVSVLSGCTDKPQEIINALQDRKQNYTTNQVLSIFQAQ